MHDYAPSETTLEIWGSQEITSLIFAGGAADFALNPENHWLFYTMELPNNPQERFIDTIQYTKKMQLLRGEELVKFADRIRQIHTKVEEKRSKEEKKEQKMSNLAFREVGDIIIDYAIRGWEYVYREPMNPEKKEEWYQDTKTIFSGMHISDLPETFAEWEQYREESIRNRLQRNDFTDKMYEYYKKDVGPWRYWILCKLQAEFCPKEVTRKLGIRSNPIFRIGYKIYPHIPTMYDWKLLIRLMLKPSVRKRLEKY